MVFSEKWEYYRNSWISNKILLTFDVNESKMFQIRNMNTKLLEDKWNV